MGFQSATGIDVYDLLKLVELYLSATVVRVNDAFFVGKEGICIGSLTEIYLNTVDIALLVYVNVLPSTTLLVTRYVDNIFVSSGNQ